MTIWIVGAAVTVASAGGMDRAESVVKRTVKGQYQVNRSGEIVGVEDFIRTTYSNNLVVVETVYEVFENDSVMVSGNNRLEFEEDSGFPRKYFSFRRSSSPVEEHAIEVAIEMFANVAVIDERQDGRDKRSVLGLPTGCLFVEGNIANQILNVLERFDPTAGGKQGFRAFDPLGGKTTDVAVETAGDSTFAEPDWVGANGEVGETLTRYRYYAGRYPGIDLYVDSAGVIKMIVADYYDMEYVLVKLDEQGGE
jgi:hypothetical protein